MKLVSSYGIEIRHMNKIFQPTINIYNKAITFCIKAFENEWSSIENADKFSKLNYAEKLIHSTKNNIAKYPDFDILFYKMPSYMRRSVISSALGYLSSYHSNLKNWNNKGCVGNKPALQTKLNQFPTFYRRDLFDEKEINKDVVKLKIYIKNDWNWVTVKLKHTDMQYIRKHLTKVKMSAPTLEKVHHKWFLRFAFEEDVKLKDTKDTILAVDLGLNTDAVCCVMKEDGPVLNRKFINYQSEKDYLYHTLNKIKKVSQKYGPYNTKKLWRKARFLNNELACKIAKEIVNTAVLYDCDVIVFEHLDIKGKLKGKKRQKLHMWKKNAIQNIVTHKAHRMRIRISRVCAWGTSKLAFDGSGEVCRGKEAELNTYSLCKFPNGKIYNCDLSASYNIGARYFIREKEKTTPVKVWSEIQAKVPELQRRTLCTYKTLIEILNIK